MSEYSLFLAEASDELMREASDDVNCCIEQISPKTINEIKTRFFSEPIY